MSYKQKLTLLIPLFGREECTIEQLKVFTEQKLPFNIHIADGCEKDQSAIVKEHGNNLSLTYKYVEHDATIHKFIVKLATAFNDISTPYTIMVDNDDFVDIEGLKNAVDFLDRQPDMCAYRGRVGRRELTHKSMYRLDSNTKDTAVERLEFAAGYDQTSCWHDTVRTDVSRECFNELQKYDTNDLQLVWTTNRYWHLLSGQSFRENEAPYYIHVPGNSLVQNRNLYARSKVWAHNPPFINSAGIYLHMFSTKLSEVSPNLTYLEARCIIFSTLITDVFEKNNVGINRRVIFNEADKYV